MTALFTHFSEGTTILTPNQRLAASLFKKYNHYQQQQGKYCWATQDLLAFNTWTERLWADYSAQHFSPTPTLLSAQQELILWEDIIRSDPDNEPLLQLSELAEQAKSAWSTLKRWQVSIQHPHFALTHNGRAFQRWAQQLIARCQQHQWLDTASLIEYLIDKIQQQTISLPPRLLLLNFIEITPLQHSLLAACEAVGTSLQYIHIHDNGDRENLAQIAFSDEEQEIQTMALWSKQVFTENPQATVGCIVPALEEKREVIARIFAQVFNQQLLFNISAGQALSTYPLIQHALQLLSLPTQKLSFEKISFLLHSPYLGSAEQEMVARLQMDNELRRNNINDLSWQMLWEIPALTTCPDLKNRLKNFFQQRNAQATLQTASQWIQHFAVLLEALGWPGEQSLNSSEYQVATAWIHLLKEATQLDNVLPTLNYSKALHYLSVLASKTFFQPQTPEAPIQILGQLEGAGIPFDYLWVAGMDDSTWPPPPTPNPFIPHELQKSLKMPNASAVRQLEYSQKLTEQFKQAARRVIFSYSQYREQEELRLSPLLSDLMPLSIKELALAPFISTVETIFNARCSETLEDQQAPALNAQDTLRGGTPIFALQAACPFKAFAKIRLHAHPSEEVEPGLSAKSRGTIIHRTLELFWKKIKDQHQLLQLDAEQLHQTVNKYLLIAIHEIVPYLPQRSIYFALITTRLSSLITKWLTLEKARPPFKVIAQEQETVLRLHGLNIKLRIDRIDEVAHHQQLIIDYKTQKDCDPQDWFGERPTEPQLPLYCINTPGTITGLAFGQIHATKIQFRGLCQEELHIAGIKVITEKSLAAASWSQQVEHWQQVLSQLLADFKTGKAHVDPKEKATCERCDLHSLCRVAEFNQLREASDDS